MSDNNEDKENIKEDIISEANYIAIFNAANDAIFIQDIESGRIVDVNQKACEMYLYPKEELLRLTIHDISAGTPPYDGENAMRLIRQVGDGESQLFQWLAKDKANRLFWVEVNLKRAVIGGRYRLLAVVRDITERKQTEERLEKINSAFLDFGPDSLENINRLTALCGSLLGADCALYNRLEAESLRTCGQWNVPSDFKIMDKAEGHICRDVVRQAGDKVFIVRNLPDTEYARTDPNVMPYGLKTYIGHAVKFGNNYVGTLCVVYKRDFIPTDEDKEIMGIIASAIGVEEERKNAEDVSRLAQFSIERAGDAIFWIGPDGEILYANDQACRRLGYMNEELLKMSIPDIDPNFPRDVWPGHWRELKEKGVFTIETAHRRKDGTIFPVEVTVNYLRFEGEEYNCAFVRDITERKKSEEAQAALNWEIVKSNRKLKQLALKDPQTGLYNYRYLSEFVEPELYRAKRYNHPLSVIMLDIDYFKSINDFYGRNFGDLVLKQFAFYLKRIVRKYDIVIRSGGEEFVIIAPATDRFKALMLAQRLLEAVNIYSFGNRKYSVKMKLSVAVSSFPEDKVRKGIDLINFADRILNKVKDDGGNRVYSLLDLGRRKRPASDDTAQAADVKALKEKIEKLTKRGKQSVIESIFAFAKTIELRDHYTGEHVEDTVHYSTSVARELGVSKEEIERIRQASVLHDLGKIGISDRILLKKSKLTKKEFHEIKKHPQVAADIIRPIQFMHDIIPLVLYHHERWDGKGYPTGLKGGEIPIGARIIAIADVYQALTSDRPYRKAYSQKKAIEMIKKGAGTQFDPAIVRAFLRVLKIEK